MSDLDSELVRYFDSALSPKAERIDAIESVILAGFAVAHRSLAAEWLALLRSAPLANSGLVAAAAVALLMVTAPLVGLFALLPFV